MTSAECPGTRSPLSVCILTCNEEDLLDRCLDSVSWADEIVVVVDAKSRDGSEKIAREKAQHVEVIPYRGNVDQKRACVALATHDWILNIDSDEVVSPSLAREISNLMEVGAVDEDVAGYELNRTTFHLGRWLRHGDFYPDWKLRLYRASRGRWVGADPHGRVEVEGRVLRLGGELQHYSYRDLADQLERIQFFSAEAAHAMAASGRRASLVDLILRPPARFVRAYFLKRGFLDGVPGFVVAVATAFQVFLKYAKRWELDRESTMRGPTSPR